MSRSGRRSGAPGRSLIERLVAHENGLIPAPMLPHDKREFPAHWTHTGHTGRRVTVHYRSQNPVDLSDCYSDLSRAPYVVVGQHDSIYHKRAMAQFCIAMRDRGLAWILVAVCL